MDDAKATTEFFSIPDTNYVTGLPELDRESLAILTTRRDVVVVRQGRITTYGLDEQQTEPRLEAEFKEPVTAIAESEAGLIVAAGGAIHRVTSNRARELASVEGVVYSIAVAGTSVFAVVGRPGRLDGTLVEIDLLRSAIVSERSLRSDAVTLSADAGGFFLGVSDGTTFRTLRVGPGDPCPDRPSPVPPRPEPDDDPCCRHEREKGKERPRDQDADRNPTAADPRPALEPCDRGQSGVPTPDGGRIVGDGGGVTRHPPGHRTPFDPCRSHLFFEVHQIRTAGAYLIAADREARNVAVLAGSDLRVLHQAQYRQGAVVLSHPSQPLMLVFDWAGKRWERKYFDKIDLAPIEIEPAFDPDLLAADSMTWVGSPLPVLKGNYAPATGHKRVLVIPALDPGQAFNDTDIGKLARYMKRAGFDYVQRFYRENSFGALSGIDFVLFGADAGPGGPVRLPKPIADYYNPVYVGAHVDLVKTGLTFPATLVFDGRERMTLNVQPQTGGRKGSTLNVQFAALLSSGNHKAYPAQIQFLGTETATISVKRPNGANKTLNLHFTPETVNIAGDAEVGAGLAKLESYLEGVIAAATAAAGIVGSLFAKPRMRRVDQGEGGLGLLVTTIAHAVATGPKLEVISVSYTGAEDPLGLNSAFTGRMTVTAANTVTLQTYLDFVTVLAQEEAGFNHAQRRLAPDPVIEVDGGGGKLKSSLFIVKEDGGPGATMSVSNVVEMGALFDSATGVPNSNVTAGRSATPKDGEAGSDGLVSDVFTAAVDRLAPPGQHLAKKDSIGLFFMPYDCIIIGVVHPAKAHATDPDFVRPDEMWSAGPTSWTGNFRAVNAPRTAVFRPHPKEIQRGTQWILAPLEVKPDVALFCHEFGHAIGLDDLYEREAGYRDDLLYLESWAMMGSHGDLSHHCGYHKWQANWIPNGRIHTIDRPKEDETLVRDVLLVPVEYWHDKDALVGAARAAFAKPDLPVVQLVELALGGDADVFGLIEARQKGASFSHNLPEDPAVLVTHCIVWWDKTRYAFNGRYRAPAHPLHGNAQLRNAGDSFDLARGKELPIKGIVVSILDRKNVAGVEVFLLRVERKHSKEFIDLFFTTGDPYYKSPDLWVDATWNNGPGGKTSSTDPNHARIYPPGQPVDQGEKIVVPDTGEEAHWMVARLRNNGNVRAEQVKVNFSICDPPGAGDNGNFKVRDTVPLLEVHPTGGGEPIFVKSAWPVPAGFKGHTCIMVEIADLKVPLDHTGAALASDDVWQANNRAQKNVDQIGPRGSSPFEPVEFEFSVNNSARWPEVAYLEPEGLPYGMTLTISPKWRKIAAGETAIFRCWLELDDKVIDASCRGDHNFRINAWRVDEDSSILWGGVEYQVRPRKRSTADLGGSWDWKDEVEITGHVAPGNIAGSVRIRLAYTGHHARWVSAELKPGGTFAYKEKAPPNTRELFSIALFEGNKYYSESRSPQRRITPPPPIR